MFQKFRSNEIMEKEKKKSRKRKRCEETWKKNVRKDLKSKGEEHFSAKKKIISPKKIKNACNEKCVKNCIENIREEERKKIFENYYKLRTNDEKRLFIASHVRQHTPDRVRLRDGSKGCRSNTIIYDFEVQGVNIRVCKVFFLNTLSISDNVVRTALKKKQEGGTVSQDQRGKKVPPNKIAEEIREGIRQHIKKFQSVESHYSRERSQRQYLGSDLNISKMYNLYHDELVRSEIPEKQIPKYWLYEYIFNYEFNLSFKPPANDTCDQCDEHLAKLQKSDLIKEEKILIEAERMKHLAEASDRYEKKKEDKMKAKDDPSYQVLTVDLQKCLPTPFLTNGETFYLRQLSTLNYTIYVASRNNAYCMLWDESISDRGSNEMASCIFKWAEINLRKETENISIWSDNCVGQNRNMGMVACYSYMLQKFPQLKTVSHKFLLRGHTHLEVDAIHSIIERSKKSIQHFSINVPQDWANHIRQCKVNNPLAVIEMEVEDFKNFKSLYEAKPSPLKAIRKSKTCPGMSEFVHFEVRKDEPGIVFYRTELKGPFEEINIFSGSGWPDTLPPIRNTMKPISSAKFLDLQKIKKFIPEKYHTFYDNLAYSSKIKEN